MTAVAMNHPPPPAEWPREVGDLFAPVRVIGKGAFASVWMAKRRKKSAGDEEDHVAIKIMKDDGYANREKSILSELTNKYPHPNIVRLHQTFKPNDPSSLGVHCFVLSLARGPTLNHILTKHGALGLVVAQSIARQLVGAVAFLHGHAVVHRDIQPCNLLVSGSKVDDDLWWADEHDVDGKVSILAQKCHITLVDFGFARALTVEDLKSDVGLKKVKDESEQPEQIEASQKDEGFDDAGFDNAIVVNLAFTSKPSNGAASRGRGRTREEDNLNSSVSHKRVRDLSALGTRNYAAPEILSGIRNLTDALNTSLHALSRSSHKRSKKTLGTCVSDYGMVADSFSVGATIRHMVTGVPPSEAVEAFIASKNHPMKKLARSLKMRAGKSSKSKRAKKYRLGADLPDVVNDLIQGLAHYDPRKRATVRSATSHPWIKAPADSTSQGKGKEVEHGGPIVYLQCG